MNKVVIKKFLNHPDKDSVISRLIEGESPEQIHIWLSTKYIAEAESRFILSMEFLKEFKDKHLDFYLHVREDILAVKAAGIDSGDIDKALSASVRKNKRYKERLLEVANTEVDVKKRAVNLMDIIESRVEQVFDKVQDDPEKFHDDHTLIKWIKLLMEALEQVNKLVNNGPDQVVQHQHTFQMADQQVGIIIDSIKEILSSMDPQLAFTFMDMYNQRLTKLSGPEEFKPVPSEVRLAEAKMLEESFIKKMQ